MNRKKQFSAFFCFKSLSRDVLVVVLTSFFLITAALSASAAEDKIDPNFNVRIQTTSYGGKFVPTLKVQPDNKILASGYFNNYNGEPVGGLIRLNPNGDLDTNFNNNVLEVSSFVNRIVFQPDGKILVFGDNMKFNGQSSPARKMARLNYDGTIDTTFNYTFNIAPNHAAVDDSGRIFVSGAFQVSENGTNVQRSLIRLNADGSYDNSFKYQIAQGAWLLTTVNNKVLIMAVTTADNINKPVFYRLNEDGSIDNSFGLPSYRGIGNTQFIVQPDNKILVLSDMKIVRFNQDGTADGTFQTINASTAGTSKISLNNDGKITVNLNVAGANVFTRFLPNGAVDTSYASYTYTFNDFGTAASSYAVQNDGSIIVGEDNTVVFGVAYNRNGFVRVLPGGGALDTGFNAGNSGFLTVAPGSIRVIAVQPDDKILLGGRFDVVGGTLRNRIARLNADATLDNSFNINMNATGNYFSQFNDVYNIKMQPDGKIILTGNFVYLVNGVQKANLVRLNPNGSIDGTFNLGFSLPDYFAPAFAGQNRFVLQPDGKIVVGTSKNGLSNAVSTVRLNGSGAVDGSFNTSVYDSFNNIYVRDIALQTNGKILIGGVYTTTTGSQSVSKGFLGRLNSDGTIDTSFQYAEEINKQVFNFRLLENNQIIVVKRQGFADGTTVSTVHRLNSDGSADASFETGGGANGAVNGVLILPDGKILLGGKFSAFNNQARSNLVKLNQNGTLDATVYAVNDEILSLASDNQNRVLIGGSFTTISTGGDQNVSRSYAARLITSTGAARRTTFDFNGDGRADFALFNQASGEWSTYGGTGSHAVIGKFGASGDKAAAADFDGDGKTDHAVFRPSEGNWYLLQTTAGFHSVRWGTAEDKPVAGDYDGDGKDDIAVFRPSNGVWYVRQSSNNQLRAAQFGANGDVPLAAADFDGDGKADFAVFRPSNNVFYWLASDSNNQFRAVQFGTNGDVPAIGDFNGDGKTDLTVFRPSNGIWYQYLTTPGGEYTFAGVGFGVNGDVPVPADYNGDGKTDIAVRRGTVWHVLMSGQTYQAVTFGDATAQAVAATRVQ